VLAKAIVEKYPNMLATESARNRIVSEGVRQELKALKGVDLTEGQISTIANEIVVKRGALGSDNKLSADGRQEVREALGKTGTEEQLSRVVGAIENAVKTKAGISAQLQEILSKEGALVLGEGSFRIDAKGEQVENKG
jgi:hypothetical protein